MNPVFERVTLFPQKKKGGGDIRTLFWRAVVWSLRFRLFHVLYASVYAWAARGVTLWLKNAPWLAALYIHRGWMGDERKAGLSDIDFVCISREESGSDPRTLRKFWSRYGLWKKALPFLGEVLVADEREWRDYFRWGGVRSLEFAGRHQALSGDSSPAPAPLERPPLLMRTLHFTECAHAYTLLMRWTFLPPPAPAKVRRRQIFKAAVDILRYGARVQAADDAMQPPPDRRRFLSESALTDGWRENLRRLDAADFPAGREGEDLVLAVCAQGLRSLDDTARSLRAAVRQGTAGGNASSDRRLAARPATGNGFEEEMKRHEREINAYRGCLGRTLTAALLDDLHRSYLILDDRSLSGPGLEEHLRWWFRFCRHFELPMTLPILLSENVWAVWQWLPYLECPVQFLDAVPAEGNGFCIVPAGGGLEGRHQLQWNLSRLRSAPPQAIVSNLVQESFLNFQLTYRWLGSGYSGFSAQNLFHYLIGRTLGLRLLREKRLALSFFDLDQLRQVYCQEFPNSGDIRSIWRAPEAGSSPRKLFFQMFPWIHKQLTETRAALHPAAPYY